MRIYSFFDIDGTSISVKEIERVRYGTHDEIRAIVIYCVPINKCENLQGKEVTILVTELEDFIFNKIEIPRWFFRKDEVYIVSGTLKPHQGKLVFVYGLPYGLLINRLNVEDREVYYRNLYLLANAKFVEAIKKLREDVEKDVANISAVVTYCKDIVRKYNELFVKTFGFVAKGPESLLATESALTLVEQALQQQAQAAPAVAAIQKPTRFAKVKAFLMKIVAVLKRLLRFRRK